MLASIFSIIFKESSCGINYYNNIPEEEALLMQNISSNVVLDSLDLWNIDTGIGLNQNYFPNSLFAKNYPNPFNPNTNIQYYLPKKGKVKINIYNSKGELIKKAVKYFSIKRNTQHCVEWKKGK